MSRYAALQRIFTGISMQIDIKCAGCGKITRHFELGVLYCNIDNTRATLLVKNTIICPKCRSDISDKKCLVKAHYFFMSLLAVNISRMGEKDGFSVPLHLRGAFSLRKQQYNLIASSCKARLRLVDKF